MNSAAKNVSRADRLLRAVQEPNLSGWGWAAPVPRKCEASVSHRLPMGVLRARTIRRMKAIRRAQLVAALSLGLMLGLTLGGPSTLATLFCGLGAGLMVAVCLAADPK